ncbi:3-deoxy-7-phosphoheptulonate synthase, partial [Candidatus Uhrbacteria bacterium RIFCSPLOWO2_02_FULL_49_11]
MSTIIKEKVIKRTSRAGLVKGGNGIAPAESPPLKPYRLAHISGEERTVIDVQGLPVGGPQVVIMAGPCSVESEEQITLIAKAVKEAGGTVLRGGAFKPRTGPYDFQGLGKRGLQLLQKAARSTGLRSITEVMDPREVGLIAEYADILQIGARNMQNYTLLREVGRTTHPVLLKRGMHSTYKEFLLAAEYILTGGNAYVMLCERGIRTHVTELRFTLDLNAVPYLQNETHLPIIVDPSHGTGRRDLVPAMSRAAIAAGADGLLIECHTDPDKSISDADQAISIETLSKLMREINTIAGAIGRTVA